MTTLVSPKTSLAEYAAEEVAGIVALRCQELSMHLGWPLVPPAVQIVAPGALREARDADVRVRAETIRGAPHREGFLASLATLLQDFMGPSVLGYFGTSQNTLSLNAELVPQQAGYVLLHELVHAAQWQNFPELFAVIDAARVATEDLVDEQGATSTAAVAARDRYESLVTFLEGHATLHGRRACEARLARDAPNATAEEVHGLVAAMTGLDPTDDMTALIYVRGETALAELDAAKVESLFRDPEQIVKLFTRIQA